LASQRLDVEVVVVDDGSSDETESSVSQIGDPRVRVHKLESTGNANRARNVGAMLSTGQVIAFLDSDDTFGPKRIDRLIDFLANRPDIDCLIDGYVEVRRRTRRTHRMRNENALFHRQHHHARPSQARYARGPHQDSIAGQR
jgi:glycosyltransferase involved in cell wall biosynthesis